MAPLADDDEPVKPKPSRRKRWLALAVVCAMFAVGAWVIVTGRVQVPERFNPWAPLDVAAEPDWLTGFKLSRARRDPTRCLAALAQTGMQYDLLPDRVTGAGCGFQNAVRLRSAGVRLGTAPSLSCPMAVVAIDHLGSYACRNVNRGEGAVPGASRSRHATADALDVAALTLADGRRISVLRSWPRDVAASLDDPAAMLLLDAHRGACRFFNGVLGPDYNAAHKDHLHLETGGYDMCL
jgi:hypothetical protein